MAKKLIPNGSVPEAPEGPDVARHGGLVRLKVRLQGVKPLLMNAMSMEQLLDIRDRRKKSKTAAKPKVREEAESKVYRLGDGRPHVPVNNLYACLIAAGQFVRMDAKRQITNATSTNLPGMLSIEDEELPLVLSDGKPATWEVDVRRGVNPNGKEAVCVVRPAFHQWELCCVLEVDQEQMPEEMARSLVDIAGKRIGLGDYRPQRKGTFGRFVVSHWAHA
jgi:hypothetical protein